MMTRVRAAGIRAQKSRKIVNSKMDTSGSGPLGEPVTWANMSPKLEARTDVLSFARWWLRFRAAQIAE
jgi:hypothetical protein